MPAGALAALAFVAIVFVGCAREDQAVPAGVVLEDVPDQETWDVALSLTLGDQPRAVVRAPYLARFERADSTFARFGPAPGGTSPDGSTPEDTARVEVEVFESGRQTATVRADRLLYLDQERRFLAEGRVVVETESGKTLRSEALTWDEAERSLRTDGFVRIVTPTEQLQGYRLVADEDLETYTLARITGQVTVEDA